MRGASPLAAAGLSLAGSPGGVRPSSGHRPSPTAAAAGAAIAGRGALAAESSQLAEAEAALKRLRQETESLEARLRTELRPTLEEASRLAQGVQGRIEDLRSTLDCLSRDRVEAAEKVGELTKRQLSEIKQLTRSPPESVRRTLAALWILLRAEKFKGMAAIQFDEKNDWPRCQRMLADEGFIASILQFDTAQLDEVPRVLLHVASNYFGIAFGGEAEAAPSADTPAKRRSGRLNTSGAAEKSKSPLEVNAVTRASEPCGSLLRWMLALVQEHMSRRKIQKALAEADIELKAARERELTLQGAAAEAEGALAANRSRLAEQEQALARLRQEESKAKRATEDLAKLGSLEEIKPRKPARPSRPAAPKVELQVEVSGSMAVIEQELARLRIPFGHCQKVVLEGDPEQALILPKIATLAKERKLKLLIEGHRDEDEPRGTDLERSVAVYQWLVEGAGVTPGMLRLGGRGSKYGFGRCAVPVPIQELIVCCSPPQTDALGVPIKPGLFFDEGNWQLKPDARSVLAVMAKCLLEDEYKVRVEGHADSGEPPAVAQERADGVCEALAALGVGREQLRPESCKSHHPLSRLHKHLNRRVEFHLD